MTSMAWQLYYQLADHARTLEDVAVYFPAAATLTGGGIPERIRVTRATPSLASVLRVSPALGRWFTEAEGVSGAPPVAVLSARTLGAPLRQRSQHPGPIGPPRRRSHRGRRGHASVIQLSRLPQRSVDCRAIDDERAPRSSFHSPASHACVTAQQLRTHARRSPRSSRICRAGFPTSEASISAAIPLQDLIVGRIASALWVLLASAGLVLLVACANVANLFLVRSETRQREVAVRRALGAGNRGVARYFFTESTLLALISGALGLMLAWGGVQLLVAFGPTSLPRLNEIRIDGVVLAFSLALSLHRRSGVRDDPSAAPRAAGGDTAREWPWPDRDAGQPPCPPTAHGWTGRPGADPARRLRAHGAQLPEASRRGSRASTRRRP